jgi:hypothetical protein
MIYIVIAAVLGFALWQLFNIVRRARTAGCASGCNGCGSNGNCSIQKSDVQLVQIEEFPVVK